jgi:hypothetical protein
MLDHILDRERYATLDRDAVARIGRFLLRSSPARPRGGRAAAPPSKFRADLDNRPKPAKLRAGREAPSKR